MAHTAYIQNHTVSVEDHTSKHVAGTQLHNTACIQNNIASIGTSRQATGKQQHNTAYMQNTTARCTV